MSEQTFTFHGVKYRYIRSKTKDHGYCKKPTAPEAQRILAVNKDISGKVELETNIHEMLHACGWSMDEEWVQETAKDITNALWELGYRKNAQDEKT